MIAHIRQHHTKTTPRDPGHYDVIDVFVQDNTKKIWEVLLYL